jgi:hypothetical protein
LCFVVHLVGDIHQPLHVACGYYTLGKKKRITLDKTPDQPHSFYSDRGGNNVNLKGASAEFHGLWDNNLVSSNATKEAQLVTMIEGNALTFTPNTGPIRGWAANWVNSSITLADNVYGDLDFTGAKGTTGIDSSDPLQKTITTTISFDKKAFVASHKKVAEDQLTIAAHNLADLLNNIQWQ